MTQVGSFLGKKEERLHDVNSVNERITLSAGAYENQWFVTAASVSRHEGIWTASGVSHNRFLYYNIYSMNE